MSERKVINKYYPPEWDPAKEEAEAEAAARARKAKRKRKGGGDAPSAGPKVRMMLPMTVQCGDATCASFLTAGTKLYARKETAPEHRYLGKITVHRFRMRCPACGSPFSIRTDPANAGYACDEGCSRPYEEVLRKEGEAARQLEMTRSERGREGEGNAQETGRPAQGTNPLVWSRPAEGEASRLALRTAGEIERLRRQSDARGTAADRVRDDAALSALLDRVHGPADNGLRLPAPPPRPPLPLPAPAHAHAPAPAPAPAPDPFAAVLDLMRAAKTKRDEPRAL